MNTQIKKQEKWFKCKVSMDTVIAIGTLLLTWLAFYIMYHTKNMLVKGSVFAVITNIGINVIIPCYWCFVYRKEKLEVLGITKKYLVVSLVIGFAIAYTKFYQLIPMLKGVNWIAHLFYNFFLFWEPFFIFGWLQSRFEKDFGIIGGIILAGVSLALYHVGSFELINILILGMNGIVFATVYRLTKNLIVMWPLCWWISASVGTLSGGIEFGINIGIMYAMIFVVQVLCIFYIYKYAQVRNGMIKPIEKIANGRDV